MPAETAAFGGMHLQKRRRERARVCAPVFLGEKPWRKAGRLGHGKTSEVIWPGVGPTQVLATLAAQAVTLGVPWKPRLLQRGLAPLTAAQYPRKRDDLKPHSLGVHKNELISAVVVEPILVVGHARCFPGRHRRWCGAICPQNRSCVSNPREVGCAQSTS